MYFIHNNFLVANLIIQSSNKIKEEIVTDFKKLLSFKSSTEYTVDSITLETIIDNQKGEQIVTLQETEDECNYLAKKEVDEIISRLLGLKKLFDMRWSKSKWRRRLMK